MQTEDINIYRETFSVFLMTTTGKEGRKRMYLYKRLGKARLRKGWILGRYELTKSKGGIHAGKGSMTAMRVL